MRGKAAWLWCIQIPKNFRTCAFKGKAKLKVEPSTVMRRNYTHVFPTKDKTLVRVG